MKFNLLVAASALVVGLSMTSMAFAGQDDHNRNDPKDPTSTAVALSGQDGAVVFDFAKGTVGSNAISGGSITGLGNIQQNNGANSIVQDQNTLGAILDCSCSNNSNVSTLSLAASQQGALVLGNVSIGATNKAANGAEASTSVHTASATQTGASNHTGSGSFSVSGSKTVNGSASSTGGNGNSSAHGDDAHAATSSGNTSSSDNDNSTFAANGTHSDSGAENHSNSESYSSGYSSSANWAFAQTAVGSANAIANFTGTGLINISQNNGNNSMLQSGNTVAAIVGASH